MGNLTQAIGFGPTQDAHQYAEEVAGLVFIDCLHEDWIEYFRTTHTAEEVKMFDKVIDPDQYTGTIKDEWGQIEHNCELIRGIEIPQDIPIRIITATQYGEDQRNLGYHPEDMAVWAESRPV